MRLFVGCDVGSRLTKVVLLDGERLLEAEITSTTGTTCAEVVGLARRLAAQRGAGAELVAVTGSGAERVAEADVEEETLACIGLAIRRLLPGVDLVLDAGGQSATCALLGADGVPVDLLRNDKCASGTGHFLELMSRALGAPIGELDQLARSAGGTAQLSSQCGVFVESEIVSHLNAGVPVADVAAGLCDAVARLLVSQAQRFGCDRQYTLTGGVAAIPAVVQRVAARLAAPLRPFPIDPRLAAAYGAALVAAEEADAAPPSPGPARPGAEEA